MGRMVTLFVALQLAAAPPPALAPGTKYDPRIPTVVQVLGHDHGERITPPEEIPIYLRALHQAAPDRTLLVEYARSWEDRPLWLFVIAAPARIAGLNGLKADLRRLADPRTLDASGAEKLVRELPVVTWLMHGVHGNEISSSDAALALASQVAAFELFGRANAARFDERGFAYFVRENYDSFYPGYGDSWPIFHGAIGMTFEQASPRGLRWKRTDGDTLTYRDAIVHHFTAAMTTVATAARNRERLLRAFYEYRRGAIQEGEKSAVREYVLLPGRDPTRALRLARALVAQGIDVRRAEEPLRAGAATIPAGAFLVSNVQPSGRLLRNLLDAHTAQDEAFVKEQERRRRLRLSDEIYDVTAWSLPLLFDVEVTTSGSPATTRTTAVTAEAGQVGKPLAAARVAYLLPWSSAAAAAVADALRSGIRVRHAGRPMTIAGRKYPIGTAIVRVSENSPELPTRLAAIVARYEAEVVPLDTGYQEEGISIGSANVAALRPARVLLAWDIPTQALSAGWARYVLERRFGQPVSAVRVSTLDRVDLSDFDVVVLPSGTYVPLAGEEPLRRLRDWVQRGGTLITLAEASRWAANERVNLLQTRTELRGGRPEVEERPASATPAGAPSAGPPAQGAAGSSAQGAPSSTPTAAAPAAFDYERSIQPERERPPNVPGGIVRVRVDEEHWLSSGLDGEVQALVEGQRVFTPIRLDRGRNVGVYVQKETLVASGLVWDEARDQLAQKAYLVHQPTGRGHVIAFAEDPNFRGFAEATEMFFINAVLLGPGYAGSTAAQPH